MTEETPNPILALIDKAVEEKTFSLDALIAVQRIKEEATKLEKDLRYARSSIESYKIDLGREQAKRNTAEENVKKWQEREAALVAREAKITELELKTAVAEAESRVYASITDKMFANRILRENVVVSATRPIIAPGQSYQSGTASETSSTNTERRED